MYQDSSPPAEENTKVLRIMGDFRRFVSSQRPSSESNAMSFSSVPFALPKNETNDDLVSLKSANVDMKVKLRQMESAYASSEKAHVKANIDLESKCEKLNSQRMQLQDKCDHLQAKINKLTSQSLEMHDDIQQMHKDSAFEISKWENNFLQLEKAKQENDSITDKEIVRLSSQNQQLSEQVALLQSQNNILNINAEENFTLMEQQRKRLGDLLQVEESNQQNEIKLAKSELQLRQLRQKLSQLEDTEIVANAFKEDMHRFRQMEQNFRSLCEENSKLRKNQENSALLQQKVVSLEETCDRLEQQAKRVPQLEVDNQFLTEKIKKMEESCVPKEIYENLQMQFDYLQLQAKAVDDNNAQLKSDLQSTRKELFNARSHSHNLEEKVSGQADRLLLLSSQLSKLRKRVELSSKERDSLREILQSYDAELTMTTHTTQLQKRIDVAVESNKKLHSRIEQLELENKQTLEESLKNKLRAKQLEQASTAQQQTTDSTDAPSNVDAQVLNEKIESLEKEKIELVDKIERLEAWIEQGKIRGDYNPDNTKVIHFAMNPADVARMRAKQETANLVEECAHLKKKIKEMEQGHEVSMMEVESLKSAKNEVHMAELRNQRLKEVFTKKIQEFRQACYSLTGYRIDSSTDGKFKLVSMYAELESDCLLFQMQENGEMQLLETDYSKSLAELINLHLHHQNSIPMFLSALSVNLFSQQTLME